MTATLVLLFLALSLNRAHSLNCYTSDSPDPDRNQTSLIIITNCTNLPEAQSEDDISCYSIRLKAKRSENPLISETDADTYLLLCSAKNRCSNFTQELDSSLYYATNASCRECNQDLCNSLAVISVNSENTDPIKKTDVKQSNGSSYRRNLYIGACGSGLVGVIGAVLRCLCCRRSKKSQQV